jgi:hypothetical protein
MAATAALISAAPQSPVADLRRALDRLGHISAALNAVRDLLVPEEGLSSVDRGNFAMLFMVIDDAAREVGADEIDWKGMSASAIHGVSDLLSPASDLNIVSRDNLCALVDLLAHMHETALAAAWQAMQKVGQ